MLKGENAHASKTRTLSNSHEDVRPRTLTKAYGGIGLVARSFMTTTTSTTNRQHQSSKKLETMTSLPRKFSEKIALHNQKQAEGDAAFQQIMQEVTNVTSASIISRGGDNNAKKSLRGTQSCGVGGAISGSGGGGGGGGGGVGVGIGGGSLPNVNNISSQKNSPPTVSFIKPARSSNLEDNMRCSRADSTTGYRERGRSESGGPMRPRPERRLDSSPYSHGPYLSPPSNDLGWRRTSSDSALHQSVQNPNNTLHSPGSQRRVLENQHYDPSRTRHVSISSEDRPRSVGIPSIPDINIYPSQQEPGIIPTPISKITSSLPDLTSFQFTSPIPTPLDQDDHQSSTYSPSPPGTSPSTLSPTSLPPRTPGRFSFGGTPPHESPEALSYVSVNSPSPTASKHLSVPGMNSGYIHSPKGYILDGSPVETDTYQLQSHIQQQPQQQQQQQQQQSMGHNGQAASQPPQQSQMINQQMLSKYQIFQQKGQPQQQQSQQQQSAAAAAQQQSTQNHQSSMSQQQQQQQQQQQRTNRYSYQQNTSPQRQSPVSPTDVPTSDSIILNQHRNSMTSYRSPQTTSRPSPQSSPVLNIKHYSNNTSPLSSAPQSPTSPCNSINSNSIQQQPYNSSNDYYNTPQAQEVLQQHFEQIRVDSPVSSSLDYIMSNGSTNSYQTSDNINVPPNDLALDQSFYTTTSQSLPFHNAVSNAQTTPNTPSSIPDITLTDYDAFARPTDDYGRRDMGNYYTTNDEVRDTFDAIDLDGIFAADMLNSDQSSNNISL